LHQHDADKLRESRHEIAVVVVPTAVILPVVVPVMIGVAVNSARPVSARLIDEDGVQIAAAGIEHRSSAVRALAADPAIG
jgi:hypothetical protein